MRVPKARAELTPREWRFGSLSTTAWFPLRAPSDVVVGCERARAHATTRGHAPLLCWSCCATRRHAGGSRSATRYCAAHGASTHLPVAPQEAPGDQQEDDHRPLQNAHRRTHHSLARGERGLLPHVERQGLPVQARMGKLARLRVNLHGQPGAHRTFSPANSPAEVGPRGRQSVTAGTRCYTTGVDFARPPVLSLEQHHDH